MLPSCCQGLLLAVACAGPGAVQRHAARQPGPWDKHTDARLWQVPHSCSLFMGGACVKLPIDISRGHFAVLATLDVLLVYPTACQDILSVFALSEPIATVTQRVSEGMHALAQVLREVQLKDAVRKLGGLDARMAEAGANLSVGQRQLFCLAR